MKKNQFFILLLSIWSAIYATDNLQQYVTDALRILSELEQQENLYIPRVLNKELYNLLLDASETDLITFMQEAQKLDNKQLINSTAAVIVDRYDLSNASDITAQTIKEQLPDVYPFIDKYITFKKRNSNTRACNGTQMSIQDYVNAYGAPLISLGSSSILNFDSKNIDSLYGLQNISNSDIAGVLLSNNCIAGSTVDPQFPSAPFAGMPNINGIALQNNNIEALPATFLNGLSYLCEFSLANNLLTSFPTNFFNGQSFLRLNLSNNKLSSTSSIVISNMPDLQIINLNNNPLGTIPGSYFQNNSALTNIYLSNTGLLTWPSSLLNNLAGLQYLDVSNNALLTFLPSTIAAGSYTVLSGNLIPSLTKTVIQQTYPLVNFIF